MSKLRGVILIVMDALRYESFKRALELGLLNNLAYIVSRGITFDRAYSLTNATDPSLTTILTGLHPLEHGIINHGPKVSPHEYAKALNTPSMTEVLAKRGWFNVAIDFLERWFLRWFNLYSSVHDPLLSSFSGKITLLVKNVIREGYDGIERVLKQVLLGKNFVSLSTLLRNPGIVTDLALRYLVYALYRKRKFFIMIHYWSTHSPYYASKQFFKQLKALKSVLLPYGVKDLPLDRVLKTIGNPYWREYLATWFSEAGYTKVSDVVLAYYAALLFIDKELGRLIKFLEYNGLLDEIAIIVTADHGESLGEHGIYFDHHGLYEVSLRIPLIFYYEPIGSSKAKGVALHNDIAPTILELANVEKSMIVNKYNLLNILDYDPRQEEPVIFLETFTEAKLGIKIGNYKFIKALNMKDAICRYCLRVHGGIKELYDLKKDPNEMINIVNEEKDLVRRLERKFSKVFLKFKTRLIASRIFSH
ncbi:sulfatase-like hydrolase/transferase [Desulfurococcaceae archaeon MEX13E-LK6-19]|nr:sulfatase-like hydrolase/transferase [Desulfurococcaceae archaeon MEX13E-LK6-19]